MSVKQTMYRKARDRRTAAERCAAGDHTSCRTAEYRMRHVDPAVYRAAGQGPAWDGLGRTPGADDTVEVLATFSKEVLREAYEGAVQGRKMFLAGLDVPADRLAEIVASTDAYIARIVEAGTVAKTAAEYAAR